MEPSGDGYRQALPCPDGFTPGTSGALGGGGGYPPLGNIPQRGGASPRIPGCSSSLGGGVSGVEFKDFNLLKSIGGHHKIYLGFRLKVLATWIRSLVSVLYLCVTFGLFGNLCQRFLVMRILSVILKRLLMKISFVFLTFQNVTVKCKINITLSADITCRLDHSVFNPRLAAISHFLVD